MKVFFFTRKAAVFKPTTGSHRWQTAVLVRFRVDAAARGSARKRLTFYGRPLFLLPPSVLPSPPPPRRAGRRSPPGTTSRSRPARTLSTTFARSPSSESANASVAAVVEVFSTFAVGCSRVLEEDSICLLVCDLRACSCSFRWDWGWFWCTRSREWARVVSLSCLTCARPPMC